jgi:hypothetical protein
MRMTAEPVRGTGVMERTIISFERFEETCCTFLIPVCGLAGPSSPPETEGRHSAISVKAQSVRESHHRYGRKSGVPLRSE